jgi:hypothetical protein
MTVLLYSASGDPLIVKVGPPIPDDFSPDDLQPGVSCQVCGCTDTTACEPPCFWVAPGVCSACCPALAQAWLVAPETVDAVAREVFELS